MKQKVSLISLIYDLARAIKIISLENGADMTDKHIVLTPATREFLQIPITMSIMNHFVSLCMDSAWAETQNGLFGSRFAKTLY